MTDHDHAPWLKLLYAWLLVGLSNLSVLEWAQLIAAILASAYSLRQLWLLRKAHRKG
jgi:hypothetical protein